MNFLITQCSIVGKKPKILPKTSPIRSTVSIEHRLVTDTERQDRQTDTDMGPG